MRSVGEDSVETYKLLQTLYRIKNWGYLVFTSSQEHRQFRSARLAILSAWCISFPTFGAIHV